jgi:hypothetical protein
MEARMVGRLSHVTIGLGGWIPAGVGPQSLQRRQHVGGCGIRARGRVEYQGVVYEGELRGPPGQDCHRVNLKEKHYQLLEEEHGDSPDNYRRGGVVEQAPGRGGGGW